MTVSVKKYAGDKLGIGSDPLTISQGVDYIVINPCPSYISASFTAPGCAIELSKMDHVDSLRVGQSIKIYNDGVHDFAINLHDGVTNLIAALQPFSFVELYLTDNSDGNGTFSYDQSFNGERIIQKEITEPYEVNPAADCGVTFVSANGGGALNLLARSSYPPNFYFNFKLGGGLINNINPYSGDLIDGSSFYSVNQWGAVTVFNDVVLGQWSIKSEKAGYFSDRGQTTDATVTTLASIVVNQLETIAISGAVTCARSDHSSAGQGARFFAQARRASGGNITMDGTPIIDMTNAAVAGTNPVMAIDVDTASQAIRIRVQGVAAQTYNWEVNYSYKKILT